MTLYALYAWSVADAGTYNSHGMSGGDYHVARAPSEARSTILSLLAQMRSEAPAYAVTDPSLSLDMTDQYAGTLAVATNPSHLQGTADLSGAVFGDGSTSRTLGAGQFGITGTPADGAPLYQIGASMSVVADGYGAKVDLYTAGDSGQRIIASVAGAPGNLAASTQTPQINLDFQPVIGTQVASRYIGEGDPFVDQLAVSVTKGTWTILDGARIPITATGTLYGPFDQQPAEADPPPVGAPVAGTEQLTCRARVTTPQPGSITTPSSGFHTWVWQIDKDAQGDLGSYLTGSYTDRLGQVTETAVVPFQPKAIPSPSTTAASSSRSRRPRSASSPWNKPSPSSPSRSGSRIRLCGWHREYTKLALALQDRMAGTSYLTDPILPEFEEAYDSVPVPADPYLSQEVVLQERPDFVYAPGAYSVGADQAGTRESYAALGIPVYLTPTNCEDQSQSVADTTFDGFFDEIRTAAAIFGVTERGEQLIASQQARIDAVLADPLDSADDISFVWWYAGTDTPYFAAKGSDADNYANLLGIKTPSPTAAPTAGPPPRGRSSPSAIPT